MRVLVTGAGGAIGSAAVAILAADGHQVLAQDLAAAALAPLEPTVEAVVAGDLTKDDHLAELATTCGGGPLDAVIAAHGIPGAGALTNLTPERVRAILAINTGTIPRLLRATLPALTDGGGAFVSIASQAALRGEQDNSVYCASKWAVKAWTEALAPELRARGVHLRTLCPGRTEGPLLERALDGFAAAAGLSVEAYVASILALVPVGRYATTFESAAAAVYLAAPRPGRPTVLATSGGEVPW